MDDLALLGTGAPGIRESNVAECSHTNRGKLRRANTEIRALSA